MFTIMPPIPPLSFLICSMANSVPLIVPVCNEVNTIENNKLTNEPEDSNSYMSACAHPRSLVRVFAVFSVDSHGSKASSGGQRRL